MLGGKKSQAKTRENTKMGIGLIVKVPVVNILPYSVSTTQSYPACFLISEMSLDLQSAPNLPKISFTATKMESSDFKMSITQ